MTAGLPIALEARWPVSTSTRLGQAGGEPADLATPGAEQVALGPLINERQLANVDRIVTETVASGATVRAGGTHDQLYYRPTVLADVTRACRPSVRRSSGRLRRWSW